jgi:hypothetical protein
MYSLQQLVDQLTTYVLEESATYPALVFYKRFDDKTLKLCVIDKSVYTSFRSFRALGMVKLKRNNPLVPYGASSAAPLDHFVGRYDGSPPVPRITVPGIAVCVKPRPSRVAQAARPLAATIFQTHADTVNGWRMTKEVFKRPVVVVGATANQFDRIRLRLEKGTECPYAGRAHTNNNLYLNLDDKRHRAEVVCYNEQCEVVQETQAIFLVGEEIPALQTNSHDAVWCNTLHTQRENTDWTEQYDEPKMRPLPLAAFIALGAGMGLGKTESVIRFFAMHAVPGDKILLVTYSRALSVKYLADFKRYLPQLGFVNYQDKRGGITDNCVIVCMDSLRRVNTEHYRFLVVDEVASVLTHFNSPLMQSTNEIVSRFELHVLQAAHVIIMDAIIDSTPIRNFVDYFVRQKRVIATWIWNSHVRATNRVAEIITCTAGSPLVNKQTLLHAFFDSIRTRLLAGEKLVVAMSTKTSAKMLEVFVKDRFPDIRYRIYHGDNESVKLNNLDQEWGGLDLLGYSPSISAGVSYAAESTPSSSGSSRRHTRPPSTRRSSRCTACVSSGRGT